MHQRGRGDTCETPTRQSKAVKNQMDCAQFLKGRCTAADCDYIHDQVKRNILEEVSKLVEAETDETAALSGLHLGPTYEGRIICFTNFRIFESRMSQNDSEYYVFRNDPQLLYDSIFSIVERELVFKKFMLPPPHHVLVREDVPPYAVLTPDFINANLVGEHVLKNFNLYKMQHNCKESSHVTFLFTDPSHVKKIDEIRARLEKIIFYSMSKICVVNYSTKVDLKSIPYQIPTNNLHPALKNHPYFGGKWLARSLMQFQNKMTNIPDWNRTISVGGLVILHPPTQPDEKYYWNLGCQSKKENRSGEWQFDGISGSRCPMDVDVVDTIVRAVALKLFLYDCLNEDSGKTYEKQAIQRLSKVLRFLIYNELDGPGWVGNLGVKLINRHIMAFRPLRVSELVFTLMIPFDLFKSILGDPSQLNFSQNLLSSASDWIDCKLEYPNPVSPNFNKCTWWWKGKTRLCWVRVDYSNRARQELEAQLERGKLENSPPFYSYNSNNGLIEDIRDPNFEKKLNILFTPHKRVVVKKKKVNPYPAPLSKGSRIPTKKDKDKTPPPNPPTQIIHITDPPVFNQGNFSICSCIAVAGAIRAALNRIYHRKCENVPSTQCIVEHMKKTLRLSQMEFHRKL